jgi:uncharacterized protein YbjQ (UPF0145 family)
MARAGTVNPKLVTTAFDLPGYRLTQTCGVVRGIVVRSRSIIGNVGAALQTLVGGNITSTRSCAREHARTPSPDARARG